ARMDAMRMGNGLDEGVEVGSLVNAETRDKVGELVQDAVARGAKVRVGGRPMDGPGYFYPPTVLVDVPDEARCFREVIVGLAGGQSPPDLTRQPRAPPRLFAATTPRRLHAAADRRGNQL